MEPGIGENVVVRPQKVNKKSHHPDITNCVDRDSKGELLMSPDSVEG